jgi:dynein heavy chain
MSENSGVGLHKFHCIYKIIFQAILNWKTKSLYYICFGFFQITNQMITACKSYISCGGYETVWTQTQEDVVRKLNDCIKLNEEYQRCFHKTKEKLEKMPNERPFEFSEMYIFGKFDTFTRRLKKIIEMFETISLYSHLSESKIEGMINNLYTFIVIVVILSVNRMVSMR